MEQTPGKRVYLEPGVSLLEAVGSAFVMLVLSSPPILPIGLSGGDHRFTCHRLDQDTVTCEVVFQPLLPLPKQIEFYYDVRGAGTKTETRTDSEGDETTYYYVTLITPAGETKAWSAASESEARQLATKIQSFRMSAESQLLVASDGFALEDFLGVALIALAPAGVVVLFLILALIKKRRRLTFDRSLYQILEEYLTPFGIRGRKTYSFRDVQQVVVERSTDSDGDSYFSVKVELASGEPLLHLSFGSDNGKARAEAEQLGQLLGCPVRLPEATS
ncbi:hypothetical protein NW841_12095 [Synechococcus sp. H60.3]|uniref:hypothetical protein n=1 Tax=Synechococcus sp. H60.3 TaxID=2967124 RepID=UPI0039C11F76